MKTIAAIPTLNAIDWIAPLVEHILLSDEVDEVWIYDNGCTDLTPDWVRHRRLIDKRLFLIDSKGMGLYEMFNDMAKKVVEKYPDEEINLAILNSDIRLPKNAISTMSKLMRQGGYVISTIDPSIPSIRSPHFEDWSGRMFQNTPPKTEPYAEHYIPGRPIGWAIVIAAEFFKAQPYIIHPSYQWWFGDDDLFRRTTQLGGNICIVRGVGSDHFGSQSDPHNPRKQEMINSDIYIFREMWN
jgi:GT2 family glycosyltransferase